MLSFNETNPLSEAGYNHHEVDHTDPRDLSDPAIVQIVRLRLLSEPGYPVWDLSYCHGRLADGTIVPVQLPYPTFSKKDLRGDIIDMCRKAGRYGKGLGIFDAISTLN